MNTYSNNMLKDYYSSLLFQVEKQKMNTFFEPLKDKIKQYTVEEVVDYNTVSETQYSEDYHYLKPWNKLNIIHKKLKLKEFINKLDTDTINKKELIQKVSVLLKNKILTKKNDVNYDSENGTIISISILKHKKNKYLFYAGK